MGNNMQKSTLLSRNHLIIHHWSELIYFSEDNDLLYEHEAKNKWRENISTLIYVKIAVKCCNIGWSKICTQELNFLLSDLFIQDEQSEHLESGHEPRGRDHDLLFKTGTWLSQQVLANPLSQYMHWAFLLHPTEYITFHMYKTTLAIHALKNRLNNPPLNCYITPKTCNVWSQPTIQATKSDE